MVNRINYNAKENYTRGSGQSTVNKLVKEIVVFHWNADMFENSVKCFLHLLEKAAVSKTWMPKAKQLINVLN